MLLQELIRNFILYREVLRPVLVSWKDSIATSYYKEIFNNSSYILNLALNREKTLKDGEELGWDISDEYDSRSLRQISGARTITTMVNLSINNSDLIHEARTHYDRGLFSREIYVLLTHETGKDNVVNKGETYCRAFVPSRNLVISGMTRTENTTTGYASKQINSFLISETHEKRESLGEFSLTHEEIPLFLTIERR